MDETDRMQGPDTHGSEQTKNEAMFPMERSAWKRMRRKDQVQQQEAPHHDVLVICTRNRATEVRACLDALEHAQDCPGRTLVVDSSDGRETHGVVESRVGTWSSRGRVLDYVHTEPGLTRQRNFALDHLGNMRGIIFFIDDDCLIPSGYFDAIRSAYDEHPGCVGVGGAVQGTAENQNTATDWIKTTTSRALLLAARPGHFTRAGANTRFVSAPGESRPVKWLTGGAMSFRMDAVDKTRFDDHGLDGYC
ncbi:MAG: glycosyltransferase family 2 protein, partial [Planctomycetales bacterium]|nr:glycosyltransferase family 2 protein [Planctomycetales bacterium]